MYFFSHSFDYQWVSSSSHTILRQNTFFFGCVSHLGFPIFTYTYNLNLASRYLSFQATFFSTNNFPPVTSIFATPSSSIPPRGCTFHYSRQTLCLQFPPDHPHCMCPFHIFPWGCSCGFLRTVASRPRWRHWLHVASKWGAHMVYSPTQLPANNNGSSVPSPLQRTTWFLFFPLTIPCLHRKLQFHLIVQHQLRQTPSFPKQLNM